MKTHDEIHAEIFGRINSLESKIDETINQPAGALLAGASARKGTAQ